MRLNAPPGWPPAPTGWNPPDGWEPPPEWPAAPVGWTFWVDERGLMRRATSKFVAHPLWTSLGAVIGVIGVVISGIQIVQATGSPPEDLKIAMVSFDGAATITGTIIDSTGSYPDEPTEIDTTPVDITLTNDGGKPSVITQIEADSLFSETMSDCTFSGAGPAQVHANYSVKFVQDDYGRIPPQTVKTDTRFEVKAGSVDRMVVTIGPDAQTASGSYPMVLATKLSLIHDDGKRLEVGTMAVVTTAEDAQKQITSKLDADCAASNLKILDQLFQLQATRSKDLEDLRRAYAKASGN